MNICIYAADCYTYKILHCSVPQEDVHSQPHSSLSCSNELKRCPSICIHLSKFQKILHSLRIQGLNMQIHSRSQCFCKFSHHKTSIAAFEHGAIVGRKPESFAILLLDRILENPFAWSDEIGSGSTCSLLPHWSVDGETPLIISRHDACYHLYARAQHTNFEAAPHPAQLQSL